MNGIGEGIDPHNRLAIIVFDISISLPALCLLIIVSYLRLSKHYAQAWKQGIFNKDRALKHVRHIAEIPALALLSFIISFFSDVRAVYVWILLLVMKVVELIIDKKLIR